MFNRIVFIVNDDGVLVESYGVVRKRDNAADSTIDEVIEFFSENDSPSSLDSSVSWRK